MDPIQIIIAAFIFILGACVGSFLNVVVYRMPRNMSLITPPSTCPKCNHKLAAYDNLPVIGWIFLRGKCRYCKNPISPRYPIVEALMGLIFLSYYFLVFHYGWGPYEVFTRVDALGLSHETYRTLTLERDWAILILHLWLISALVAASLIDLEHYIIPLEICWTTAAAAAICHGFLIGPNDLGSLHQAGWVDALAGGGGVGLLISIMLLSCGLLKRSFADDAPPMENELENLPENERPDPWPKSRIRQEMRREILFLFPPVALGILFALVVQYFPAIGQMWEPIASQSVVSGILGALFGALIGGAIVWFFRIAGSYGFGREAMGLGDVHLMFAVGAVLGGGASVVAFFIAPAFGLLIAVIQLFAKGRREMPYGPYLSLATIAVLLFYTPIKVYLAPGMTGLVWALQELTGTGAS